MTESTYKYQTKPTEIQAFKWTADMDQGGEPKWINLALQNGSAKIEKREDGTITMRLKNQFSETIAYQNNYIYQKGDGLYAMPASEFEASYRAQTTDPTLPINTNWTDENGNQKGGQSTGIGYTIAWQRGGVNVAGRNGAFIIEVLESCLNQLEYFQDSKFGSTENVEAISHLNQAIGILVARRERRLSEGTLGTHELDK